jgi:hypothetical protein
LLAFVGLPLSVIAHVSTFVGVDLQDPVPAIWLLQVGIFVVFFPAVLVSPKKGKDQPKRMVGQFSPVPRNDTPDLPWDHRVLEHDLLDLVDGQCQHLMRISRRRHDYQPAAGA